MKQRGFTLIEVMVALAVMGILTVMAWQGIEGIIKAQRFGRARSDEVAMVQTLLAQWQNDLNAIDLNASSNYAKGIPPLQYDGQILRLVRADDMRSDRALRVVCWAKRTAERNATGGSEGANSPGVLMRWQSPPITTATDLRQAWNDAQTWAQGSNADTLQTNALALLPITDWKLQVFQNGAWLETGPITPDSADRVNLQGLRLVFTPQAGSLFAGAITRDWIRPSAPGL